MRDKYFPSSWDSGEDRFCALFHKYAYIYKPLSGGNWLSAEEKWQLTDTEILKAIACAHKKYFIGTRSGKASWFAVLDIDTKSKYHTLGQVEKIRAVLKAAGIENVVPYRSSSSGGWHLYIFFDQPVSSRDLNKQLTLLLQLNNFKVEKGQLEIFPNPGTHGSLGYGLRLPLQPGWAWLNPETLEPTAERDEITAVEALGLFLLDMDTSSNKYHDFHQLKSQVQELLKKTEKLPKAAQSPGISKNNVVSLKTRMVQSEPPTKSRDLLKDVFGTIPPGIIPDVWEQGRSYYAHGLTGPSQRADAIFSLGHYLFYGDPQRNLDAMGYGCEQIRQELIEEIISCKHNGQSDDLNEGRADALAQIRRASNWRPADKLESTPYFDEIPIAWILENAKRKRNARARIAHAVNELRTECRQLTATLIQSRARCSWTTLYKHSDLWKETWTPDTADQNDCELMADELMGISTHEYNAVVGGSDLLSNLSGIDSEHSLIPAISIFESDDAVCSLSSNEDVFLFGDLGNVLDSPFEFNSLSRSKLRFSAEIEVASQGSTGYLDNTLTPDDAMSFVNDFSLLPLRLTDWHPLTLCVPPAQPLSLCPSGLLLASKNLNSQIPEKHCLCCACWYFFLDTYQSERPVLYLLKTLAVFVLLFNFFRLKWSRLLRFDSVLGILEELILLREFDFPSCSSEFVCTDSIHLSSLPDTCPP